MSKSLNDTVATMIPDKLINSIYPPAMTFAVYLRPGQGTLERGALLSKSSADENMVITGTAPETDEELTANCILTDAVEVSGTEPTLAIAYRTGHFNQDALIVKVGYEITEKDKEALRDVGILLSDAISI